MTSQAHSVPTQTHSKIPKLQVPPSPSRNRTASFLHGEPPNAVKQPPFSKTQSAVTSPRQHATSRYLVTHSDITGCNQAIPSLQLVSASIKSKSEGGTSALQSPRVLLQNEIKASEKGQGDLCLPAATIDEKVAYEWYNKHIDKEEMDSALTGMIKPSGSSTVQNRDSTVPPVGESEMKLMTDITSGSKSADVNILYTASPMQNESTSSVTVPYCRKSPTYLDIYRHQKEIKSKTLSLWSAEIKSSSNDKWNSMGDNQMSGDSNVLDNSNRLDVGDHASLEWDDYSSSHSKEVCTQTSRKTVNTVDRASSAIPIPKESLSKESLLENQTKPLSVLYIDQITEQEDSDVNAAADLDDCNDNYELSEMKKDDSQHAPFIGYQGPDPKEETEYYDDFEEQKHDHDEYCLQKNALESENWINNISSANVPYTTKDSSLALKDDDVDSVAPPTAHISCHNFGIKNIQSHSGNLDHSNHGITKASEIPSFTPVPDALQDWQAERRLSPKLNVSPNGGAIEIQPSPVPLTAEELQINTRLSQWDMANNFKSAVDFSVKSSIILQHCNTNHGRILRGSFELFNSTSFLHGFKVVVNAAAKAHLKITPSFGTIPPHGRISIIVSTQSTKYSNESFSNFRIVLKLFRPRCDDLQKLREFYSLLEDQHPELIQSRPIEKIFIWNNDDLPQMLEMINSMTDKRERENFKTELHHQLSEHCVYKKKPTTTERLTSLRMGMLVANQNLRNIVQEIVYIRTGLLSLCFLGMIVFAVTTILPPFMAQRASTEYTELPKLPNTTEEPYISLYERLSQLTNKIKDYLQSTKYFPDS